MSGWQQHIIIVRTDGSYLITHNGLPYHVPNEGEWTDLYAEVAAYAAEHPDQVAAEVVRRPSTEEIIQRTVREYTAKVQQYLDDFARTKTYDGILSACTYATSTVPEFAAEGQYCVEARDFVWQAANAVLNAAMENGKIPPWGEIKAQLPVLAWPEGSRDITAA